MCFPYITLHWFWLVGILVRMFIIIQTTSCIWPLSTDRLLHLLKRKLVQSEFAVAAIFIYYFANASQGQRYGDYSFTKTLWISKIQNQKTFPVVIAVVKVATIIDIELMLIFDILRRWLYKNTGFCYHKSVAEAQGLWNTKLFLCKGRACLDCRAASTYTFNTSLTIALPETILVLSIIWNAALLHHQLLFQGS